MGGSAGIRLFFRTQKRAADATRQSCTGNRQQELTPRLPHALNSPDNPNAVILIPLVAVATIDYYGSLEDRVQRWDDLR